MTQFYLPEGVRFQNVVELLKTETRLRLEPSSHERLTLYDTFDWRLFQNSFALIKTGAQFILHDWSRQRIVGQIESEETPQFVWDMPPGLLRTTLSPILSIRALIPMADVVCQKNVCRILNRDEKIVARVIFEEIYPQKKTDDAPLLTRLTLQPVRGYAKAEARLTALFIKQKFQADGSTIIPKILTAVGQHPGSYSAKHTIDLKPTMRADAATNIILRYMLQIMKMNESYIKQDIDTEFLHDFRVAVRRTRSALSQVKAVFPEDDTERFKQDFKFIGQLSNQLRDLDVYLLAEEDYKAQLPEFLQADIHPLFEHLQSKRAEALQAVVTGLESPEYRRIIQDWELFLEEPPHGDETAVNAATPILKLAKKRINKRYQRIIHDGNVILVDDRDELLHELRIECKKLRYLMEFFASLFPPPKISRLVRQLKQLQDNLGDFNDFCVQEEYLLHVARKMPIRGQPSRDALIAIGCLVGTLHQRREQVKSEFAGAFNQFASQENEALFAELFASKKSQKKQKKGGKV